jgi:hypothetical protein
MPAVSMDDPEPDERTLEYAAGPAAGTTGVPPGPVAAEPLPAAPRVHPRRVRIVLTAVVLVAVAAALLVWGLLR